MNKSIKLLIIEIIIVFIISIVLNNFIDMIKFTTFFILLYFIPILPWVSKIKMNLLEKMIIINTIGLALIPIVYIIIGSFTKLSTILYILGAAAIFIVGILKNRKENEKH
ncbi:MAG: hypothetical protein ABIH25_01630 [Candidatus Woesearchaeota archaeon]